MTLRNFLEIFMGKIKRMTPQHVQRENDRLRDLRQAADSRYAELLEEETPTSQPYEDVGSLAPVIEFIAVRRALPQGSSDEHPLQSEAAGVHGETFPSFVDLPPEWFDYRPVRLLFDQAADGSWRVCCDGATTPVRLTIWPTAGEAPFPDIVIGDQYVTLPVRSPNEFWRIQITEE
jgi:hypothetical protein